MQSPQFPRRKAFLMTQAALAALALSLSVPATAADVNIGGDGDLSLGTNYVNIDALQAGGSVVNTVVPNNSGTPFPSNNTVTIDNWSTSTSGNSSAAGGGSFTGGETAGNTLTIKNGSAIGGKAVGGAVSTVSGGTSATAKGNKVTVDTSTVGSDVIGGLAQGENDGDQVLVEGNEVRLTGSTTSVSNYVYGGWAGNVDPSATSGSVVVKGNKVFVEDTGTGVTDIGGGRAHNTNSSFNDTAIVEGNEVSVRNAGNLNDVYGGSVLAGSGDGIARGNKVAIENGSFISGGDVTGGHVEVNGAATGNTVTLMGGSFNSQGDVIGGHVDGNGETSGNAVTLTDVTVSGTNSVEVYGGRLDGDGTASANSATLNGSTKVHEVLGAAIDGNGNATGNTATLNDDAEVDWVFAAHISGDGDAAGNAAILNGKAKAKEVYGARIDGSGDASHNTVNLEDTAEIVTTGKVVGGQVGGSGDATHNTVNVGENVTLANDVTLAGGAVGGTGDAFTGNTLNLKGWTGSVGSVNSFATYNVQVPQNLAAGAAIVTLTDSTSGSSNLEGSEIKLFTQGGAPLVDGSDVVVFSGAAGALALGSGLANGGQSQGQHGISLLYGLQTALDGSGNLKTTVTGVRVNPQTKALSEGFISGVAFVNHAADLAAGQGLSDLRARTGGAGGSATGLVGFGALSYADSRYETGSHVDVKGYNFLVGLGSSARLPAGTLALGGFFETGEGDYDTSNRFAGYANVKGDGDTRYYGGGVLGRFDFENGLYAEGSLRAGRLKNDFSSDIVDPVGIRAKYDTRGRYVSTHLGLGYGWALNPGTRAEVYGKYLWTHQAGDSVTLSTGDPVKFSAVDSQRLRLGGRVTWALSGQTDVFAGAAWEHEFDADARAKVYGYRISAPSLEGDSGMGEIGIVMRPAANSPISLQATLQGYGGDRKGVAGGFNLKYAF
jgi:hypothetical protein